MIREIEKHRSIRKYKPVPVPEEAVKEIIRAGMLAPSSKNRQPWKFVITTSQAKEEALTCMEKGLEREKAEPLIPESAPYISGAENTLRIMQEAPVLIFITGTLAKAIRKTLNTDERIGEICNAQSVMPMRLRRQDQGSLWKKLWSGENKKER